MKMKIIYPPFRPHLLPQTYSRIISIGKPGLFIKKNAKKPEPELSLGIVSINWTMNQAKDPYFGPDALSLSSNNSQNIFSKRVSPLPKCSPTIKTTRLEKTASQSSSNGIGPS